MPHSLDGAAEFMMLTRTITAFATVCFTALATGSPSPAFLAGARLYKPTHYRWSAPRIKAAVVAKSYLGTPYRWGGAGPAGFDCSGLVQYSYGQAGIELPRTAARQKASASPVTRGELRQGDLIFFHYGRRLHVGIYLGQGRFIHAPRPGKRVMYSNLNAPYWQSHFQSGGRILAN